MKSVLLISAVLVVLLRAKKIIYNEKRKEKDSCTLYVASDIISAESKIVLKNCFKNNR